MSDMSEYYEDYDYPKRDFGEKGLWVVRNGDEVKINKMETSHILNCIRFLNNNWKDHPDCDKKIDEFELEIRLRKGGV